jgi:hypothetical protein
VAMAGQACKVLSEAKTNCLANLKCIEAIRTLCLSQYWLLYDPCNSESHLRSFPHLAERIDLQTIESGVVGCIPEFHGPTKTHSSRAICAVSSMCLI